MYVADSGNNRILRFLPLTNNAKNLNNLDDGNSILQHYGEVIAGGIGEGDSPYHLKLPTAIALDQLGRIVVADSGNHRVMRYKIGFKGGEVIAGGTLCHDEIKINMPNSIAIDSMNRILVADSINNRIVRYTNGKTAGEVI